MNYEKDISYPNFRTSALSESPSPKGTTYIVFRYDDFSADQRGDRETNALKRRIWETEQCVDALFEKYNMPYVISIIPKSNLNYNGATSADGMVSFLEDREKIEFIKQAAQAGRIEVAQHGFSHTNAINTTNHRPGEFRERDYESQFKDILEGRKILQKAVESADISTFVPPWNAWTDDTAKILKKLGFKILSADRHYYYKSAKGLKIIPYTVVPQELELMVVQKLLPEQGIIVVCYHPFEIVSLPGELGSHYFGIERLEKLLQKLSTMHNVKVVTFTQLAEKCEDLTFERYKKANKMWRQRAFWAKLLPPHLWPGVDNQKIYLTGDEYSRTLSYWQAATVTFVAGLFITGLLVRYLLSSVLSAKWCFRIDVLATLLFCLSIIAEFRLWQRGYHTTGIRAIPLFFSISFVIVLVLQAFS